MKNLSAIAGKKITKNKIQKNAFGNGKLENITTILRSIKNEIKKNSTFVGDDFVNQARLMNQGQIKEKSIYGRGTKKEIEELTTDRQGAYWNKMHPNHNKVVNQMLALREMLTQ